MTITTHSPQGDRADVSTSRFRDITWQCIIALLIGVAVAQFTPQLVSADAALGNALRIVARGWANAFRLLAVPLTACLVFAAILANNAASRHFGRISVSVPPVLIALMVPGFALAYVGVPALMALPAFHGLSIAQSSAPAAATGGAATTYQWIDDVVPPNLFGAVLNDNILGVIVVTVVLALALRQTKAPLERLASAAQLAIDAMFVIAAWLMRVSPVVVFAATVQLAADGASKLAGILLAYVMVEGSLILVLVLIMLGLAMIAFGGSPRRVLQAIAPAQLAALTTRSSLATLPLVIRAAERDLGVHGDVAGYVTSLAGALLKVSRSMTSPARLMILASVLAIPVGASQYLGFCLTILALSISTSGVPKAVSGNRSLSAYVAAGMPPGPVTLLGSLTWATDPLLTLVNTTSYFTATLWVARLSPLPSTATPSFATAPAAAQGLS